MEGCSFQPRHNSIFHPGFNCRGSAAFKLSHLPGLFGESLYSVLAPIRKWSKTGQIPDCDTFRKLNRNHKKFRLDLQLERLLEFGRAA